MFTFALCNNSLNWDVKKFTKQVKTKTWVKRNKKHLHNWANRLTSANRDNRQVIGGMLQSAYGVNMGRQIESNLTDENLISIRTNIIQGVYF